MGESWVLHHSHLPFFRQPFGAAACGSPVTLSLSLRSDRLEHMGISLRLWQEETGEILLPMVMAEANGEWRKLSVTFTAPSQPGLVWYYFILARDGGDILYYGNNELGLGGEGRLTDRDPQSYQITVVPQSVSTPDWWKDTIVYQIFPDRFCKGCRSGVLSPRKNSLLHANWDDNPVYVKDETGRILAYDFFGGNLAGVAEKLPYLRDLGITAIYFNPLFAAPSNHKYDTADYHTIDQMFGSNEEFQHLCALAREAGISIVLDGVFSHTGSDSLYFNREETYPVLGAFQSQQSVYYPWYRFIEFPHRYDCWWGVDALPNVNEMEPTYRHFIISGEHSVLRHWLRMGIKGWRLDVVDELPDEFVQEFQSTLKDEDPEAILLGEVWEDASHKISYGRLREYFWGNELDSVMNYPFRQTVLDFLLHRADAQSVHQQLMSLFENYPRPHFYSALNLIGSHDVPRILTLLGEAEPEENLPGTAARAKARLSPAQRALGLARVKLAVLWQMTFPGTPSVYYGDEAGLEGYRDPLNRRTYPWRNEESALVAWHRQLIHLRRQYAVLRTGDWLSLPCEENVYGYLRTIRESCDQFGRPSDNNTALVLMNRSNLPVDITVPVPEMNERTLADMLCGEREVAVKDGRVSLTLLPHEGKLLLEQPVRRKRAAGVLLHPTSLPSRHGIGDLGPQAYAFIDWLADAKQSYWQVLPLCPPGLGDSPYQALSAFAGNPLLISPDMLMREGLLKEAELNNALAAAGLEETSQVQFRQTASYKDSLFRQAFTRFAGGEEFEQFCCRQAVWLDDYVLFMALSDQFGGQEWTSWPRGAAYRLDADLEQFRRELEPELHYHRFLQFLFARQWQAVKQYANRKGIAIIGDLPLFVAHHSADVWANPQLFALDDDLRPELVAGVPPDYFSETGQLWGNPQYCWESMKQDEYRWWRERLASQFAQADIVRIDHFRGLAAYWQVSAKEETAIHGRWVKGPGEDFLLTCFRYLGKADFIAEDLGVITPDVDELRWRFGLPGMQVLHFAFSVDNTDIPDEKHTVLYTGTHDNNTSLGWLRSLQEDDPALYRAVGRQIGADGENDFNAAERLMQFALSRRADTVILPMQDILGLGAEARLNTPGTPTGNWGWRMRKDSLDPSISGKLREWIEKTNRY